MGATYISTNSTNPTTLFGFGTWERIEGQFLLGATDEAAGSGASYAAGATGGAATVTLTSAQSGLPAHNHGTTITQPAFSTPELTHTVTQPTVKYTAPASHTHNLAAGNAGAAINFQQGGNTIIFNWKAGPTWAATNFNSRWYWGINNASGGWGTPSGSNTQTNTIGLTGKTEGATGAGTSNGTNASVSGCAVAKHSATACTRATDVGVTVSNNTAADATAAHNNMPPFLAVYIWYRSA